MLVHPASLARYADRSSFPLSISASGSPAGTLARGIRNSSGSLSYSLADVPAAQIARILCGGSSGTRALTGSACLLMTWVDGLYSLIRFTRRLRQEVLVEAARSPVRTSSGSRIALDDAGLVDYCSRPSCRREFRANPGPGRPQAYCSELCRRAAEKELRQARSRLAHFENLVEKLRIDVAAFGKPDTEPEADERHQTLSLIHI